MTVTFKEARRQDLDFLLPLIREFYEIEQLPYDEATLKRVLNELFSDNSLGRFWMMQYADDSALEPALVGYMVMVFGFSLEFHGRDALLDEFYVREPFRGRGIGNHALDFISRFCGDSRIRALHLEVDWVNDRARNLYLRKGFRDHKRHLMTKRLD